MMSLEGFARCIAARFGEPVWLVGSYLTAPEEARDVDLRVVVSDAQFAARYGSVQAWSAGQFSQRLLDDTAHLNVGGSIKTGLNLDLQIWPRSGAEASFPAGRRRLLAAPRVLNADVQLQEFMRQEIGKPYRWGETDCASLVRRATAVMFGADLFEGVATWKSKAKAARLQAETGGVRAVMTGLGARLVPLAFAQAGDVAVAPAEDGFPFAGVVVERRVLTSAPKFGVFAHGLASCPPDTELLRWHHG